MLLQKILLAAFFIFVLIACRKEELPSPMNAIAYAHLVGDFEAEVERRGSLPTSYGSGSVSWKELADGSVSCTIENNQLVVLGYPFELDSVGQTVFSYTGVYGSIGILEITVEFTNNYDSMYIFYKKPCYNDNCDSIYYKGKRGVAAVLPSSGTIYDLLVVQKSTFTSTDTQYRKDIAINYQQLSNSSMGPKLSFIKFDLDRGNFDIRNFSSWAESWENDSDIKSRTRNIYWKNDSFYLEQQFLDYPMGLSGVIDTVYYSYKGRKK